MFTTSLLVTSALAIGASALPPFALATIRSATILQYAPISVNSLTLATYSPTTAVPAPDFVDQSAYTNSTVFNLADDGSLTMAIGGTGIQYVYVAPQTGLARVTPAHTDYIPNGGEDNFTISGNPPILSTAAGQAYACGSGPSYTIEFSVPALNTANCLAVDLLVEYFPEGTVGAWEYD